MKIVILFASNFCNWPFSMNLGEFKKMVDMVCHFEKTGEVFYGNEQEEALALSTHSSICFEPTEKEMVSQKIRPLK